MKKKRSGKNKTKRRIRQWGKKSTRNTDGRERQKVKKKKKMSPTKLSGKTNMFSSSKEYNS